MDQRDCLPGAVAAQARVEVGAIRPELSGIQYLRLDAFAIENRFQKSRGEDLVAGRIGGVDAKVVGKNGLRFAGE